MVVSSKRIGYTGRHPLSVRPHSHLMKHIHQTILASLISFVCVMQAQAGLSGQFITTFGEISSSDCPWSASVSATNQAFHISYRYAPDTNSSTSISVDSPSDWKAKPGWFVYIESDARVWAYDGGSSLFLQVATVEKRRQTCTSYGSRSFPCPVPVVVMERLSPEARKAIKVER